MRIRAFRIENYKSFLDSGNIDLTPGFNVIVGPNNVGKTALVEALSLRFSNQPHRSLSTAPTTVTVPIAGSQVSMSFELSTDELRDFLQHQLPEFYVPILAGSPPQVEAARFIALCNSPDRAIVDVTVQDGALASTSLSFPGLISYPGDPPSTSVPTVRMLSDRHTGEIRPESGSVYPIDTSGTLVRQLAGSLQSRVYSFKAERMNVGEVVSGGNPQLAPNASNLPEALNQLQSNPWRFGQFNDLVRTVLPDVKQVTVTTTLSNTLRILVWTVDPASSRQDLAVPLVESGTGIGQVLAIVYVVLTSEFPRTIIVDEPQSFLHPGAIRKLFDVLKFHSPHEHQYIVTTHSPTVVTASQPQTLLLVRKDEMESKLTSVDFRETQSLRVFLSDIGARLTDVFGADNILWVEGQTEERSFPLIHSRIIGRPLLGTEILGVRQTGDLEGKHAKTVFDIYRRLSTGRGLLPPAIGFIFDQEGRSDKDQEDLVRESQGLIHFLSRRMFENYLIDARAIAAIASNIEGFAELPDHDVTQEQIETWLQTHRWDNVYFASRIQETDRSQELWEEEVHGAKLLADLFSELSEQRVNYDKTAHGVALTEWLLENDSSKLQPVADLIAQVLEHTEGTT